MRGFMTDLADKILQIDRSQEEAAAQKKATALGFGYINLQNKHIDSEVLKIVPKEKMEALQSIPIETKSHKLIMGVVEPDSQAVTEGLAELEQMTGYKIEILVVSASSYAYAHKSYELLVKENEGERPVIIEAKSLDQLLDLAKRLASGQVITGVSVTESLSAILAYAVLMDASDIHFEPTEAGLDIRFRIDGVLHLMIKRSLAEYHSLSSRIKYLAKMPLAALEEAEDGRFTIKVAESELDLRVGSLPTVYGDMITMRILQKERAYHKFADLGLRPDLETTMRDAFTKPHGMVLVTGPTGSGKTTTLYAMLNELNTQERKIITIEDPVEYKIAGIEQVQVDEEHKFDFAQALRGALRQDPDVLMVGEIRDQETAGIGVRAALTGHVVLATVHANDAPSAYNRLLEMGLEPFLFTGSINLVIAQRLIRILCPYCKKPVKPTESEAATFTNCLGRVPSEIYQPVGCEQCNNLGYKGRTGIFEAFVPTPAMESLVYQKSPLEVIERQAAADGLIKMMVDGLLKVEIGVTSLDEVMRVTKE